MFNKPIIAKQIIVTAFVFVPLTAPAFAEEKRYDRSIEAASIARAAEQIGEIRGSIDHEDTVDLTTRENVRRTYDRRESLLPNSIWIAPKPKNPLPPIVSEDLQEVDPNFTASIGPQLVASVPRLIWEKFDSEGNPID